MKGPGSRRGLFHFTGITGIKNRWILTNLRIAIISFSDMSFKKALERQRGCRRSLLKGEGQMSVFKRFLRDQSGATAIEYGLIAAGIAVAIVVVVKSVGTELNTTLTSVQNGLK
jgi:pilus assembly protein Flp/PilA